MEIEDQEKERKVQEKRRMIQAGIYFSWDFSLIFILIFLQDLRDQMAENRRRALEQKKLEVNFGFKILTSFITKIFSILKDKELTTERTDEKEDLDQRIHDVQDKKLQQLR